MITLISATNRPNSATLKVAKHVKARLETLSGEAVQFVDLVDLPAQIAASSFYAQQDPEVQKLQNEVLIPSDKWFFVVPEYNGSIPGILKLFIDALSIREADATFKGKKVALLGVAAGRAGNLRGLDHLTGILQYMKMHVHPNRLPMSQINRLLDEQGQLQDAGSVAALDALLEEFLAF